MAWQRSCVQCGKKGNGIDLVSPELPDGTWDPNTLVCRNKVQCRDRWWARFAYELEVG